MKSIYNVHSHIIRHSLRETEGAGVLLEQTIFDYATFDLILGKYFLSYHGLMKQSVLFPHKYTAVKLDAKTHFNGRK